METDTGTTLKPLIDEPAIIVENEYKTLVIADLHLGIEAEFRQKGINIGSQTEKLLARAIKCLKATEPDAIILLGDVKHAVPKMLYSDRKEVPFFLAQIAEYAPVYVVKGNHDSRIDELMPAALAVSELDCAPPPKHATYLKGTEGFLFDHVGYTHGHSWPSQELFSAEYILIGHNHPQIRLVSSGSGYRGKSTEQAWITARCDYEPIKKRYPAMTNKEVTTPTQPQVIIVPAFNELCGGLTFNTSKDESELLGPISSKLLCLDAMEVHLLDGTYIGKIRDLKFVTTPVQSSRVHGSKFGGVRLALFIFLEVYLQTGQFLSV
ncbi:MAG: metallophosphoesterase [Methanophagales archaeon]|nr:metallophosphoesterase [Methanophagales archaeon]